MPAEMLSAKLKPIEEALVRLETPQDGPEGDVIINPDLHIVLRGLLDIVRELAQFKWTQGDG